MARHKDTDNPHDHFEIHIPQWLFTLCIIVICGATFFGVVGILNRN